MAALAYLERKGLTNSFDFVMGSSAGAINAMYFLAGQADEAVRVYIDDISNRNFVNSFRFNRIVDIDFLVNTLKTKAPLNFAAIRQSKSTFHLIMTHARTAEPVVVTNREEEVDLYEAIRATAALPGLYNKRVELNGEMYVDGGIADIVPVMRTIDYGCRDVLTMITAQKGFTEIVSQCCIGR